MPTNMFDTPLLNGEYKITLEDATSRIVRGFEQPVADRLRDLGLWTDSGMLVSVVTSVKTRGEVEGSLLSGFGKIPLQEIGVRKLWPQAPQNHRNLKVKFAISLEDITFPGSEAEYGVSGNTQLSHIVTLSHCHLSFPGRMD